ncbi:MAG TPA: hypothetical protein VFQ53_23510 [Kofleriaceae bacterium]|nr:hypothetical protein [Kofleriaceae bacterium]
MIRTICILAALVAGCYVPDGAGPSTTASVTMTASTPDLVAVGPGVSVIADYDEPIFYSDGFYWWCDGGVWYRSTYYTGGWAYVATPPVFVARIGSPYAYRHYRPAGYVSRSRPVYYRGARGGYRGGGGTYVRDHRRR